MRWGIPRGLTGGVACFDKGILESPQAPMQAMQFVRKARKARMGFHGQSGIGQPCLTTEHRSEL